MSFQRVAGENNTTKDHRGSFSYYYVQNARIKDFNVLTDGKSFFDLPVKNEEEAYEKITEMNNNNDCTTGNLLGFAYLKKITKLKDPRQINFIGKLESNRGIIFFIIEKSEERIYNFSQNCHNHINNGNTKECKFARCF